MKYERGRQALEQPAPGRAQRGPAATEWGEGAPASGRFETCRWHAKPDNGGAPYCAHRDVLPYAGMNGFNPEAWCPDCRFFKMRRGTRRQARYVTDDF